MFSAGIYAVISEQFCQGRSSLNVLNEVVRAGVAAVQLREKELDKRSLYHLALQWKKKLTGTDITFIINDHLDIALAVGADGVHLGQDDLPVSIARQLAPELIIGLSSHNLQEALQAEKDGASYVNIGPIYKTATKLHLDEGLGIEQFKMISAQLKIPFTVMGGIKQKHLPDLVEAGADRVAMVTEITQAENIFAKVSQLKDTISTRIKE